ncbi:MAG: LapA family protein [Ilumatobacteraceae bacterium]
MNDRNEIDRNTGAVHRRDLARLLRLVVIAALLLALVLFGLDNRDDVRIGYVVGDTSGPIWLVILASALSGLLIGALTRRRHTHD